MGDWKERPYSATLHLAQGGRGGGYRADAGEKMMPIFGIGYERRFVGFLDILGWKAATEESPPPPRVQAAVGLFHREADSYSRLAKFTRSQEWKVPVNDPWADVEVAACSDGIFISLPETRGLEVVDRMAGLARELLALGFLSRGGIDFGDAYHHENVVLGPAVVGATRMDSSERPPGLELSERAKRALSDCSKLDNYMLDDGTGRQVVNLFTMGTSTSLVILGSSQIPDDEVRWMMKADNVESAISDGIARAADNPKHLRYWTYMRDVSSQMQRKGIEFFRSIQPGTPANRVNV